MIPFRFMFVPWYTHRMKIAVWVIVALLAVLLAGQMVFVWSADEPSRADNPANWEKPRKP